MKHGDALPMVVPVLTVLNAVDFKGKDAALIGLPDPAICGGPDLRPKG